MYIAQRTGEGSLYEKIMIHFEKKNYIPAVISVNKQRPNYINVERLRAAECAKDFDGEFFVKVLGYRNGGDYYRRVSSYDFVGKINIKC